MDSPCKAIRIDFNQCYHWYSVLFKGLRKMWRGRVFLLFFVPLCTAVVTSSGDERHKPRATAVQGGGPGLGNHGVQEAFCLLAGGAGYRYPNTDHSTGSLSIMGCQRAGCTPTTWIKHARTWQTGGSLRAWACQHCVSLPLVPLALHFTHLLTGLLCFPFLFEEACLVSLTTLNEDKARVCNNRLKLNFKQIIC